MKPIIGISVADCGSASAEAVATLAADMGAEAWLVDDHAAREAAADIQQMQACIVMGNDLDIDPSTYIDRYESDHPMRQVHPRTLSEFSCERAKARAVYEAELIGLAVTQRLPMVGVCGGMQRMNVVLGGTLHQHLPDLVGDDRHCQRTRGVDPHTAEIPIVVEGGTILAEIACGVQVTFLKDCDASSPKVIYENSVHHQAVDRLAEGLRRCAVTDVVCKDTGKTGYIIKGLEVDPDGIYANQFILGLQWHPEFCASEMGAHIIRRLVAEAERNLTS